MGLFNSDRFSRPGPGVSPDEPRKKGLARLAELLGRDGVSFYMAGLLALVSLLPYLFGLWVALASHSILPMLLAGLLGGALAAPQLCGLIDTILRALRDEPGYFLVTYRRAWKQNARASLLPGALGGLVIAAQLLSWSVLDGDGSQLLHGILLAGMFLAFGLLLYLFAQIPLMDLPLSALLKNAAFLFLGYLANSALGVLALGGYLLLVYLFFPLSLGVLLLTNAWLPVLLALMAIYKPLDKTFSIEQRIKAKRDAELAGGTDLPASR